jgi:predicted CoA-binding protein
MLDGLLKPRAIAVVGASNNPFSIGYIVIQNLVAHGFKGPIFPVNPKGGSIQSFKAFKSVLDVPDEIDLVNISVGYKLVPGVIEECGRKGIKFAIVHTAGFKEVGGDGIQREKELVALAHRHGMRIFGPNRESVTTRRTSRCRRSSSDRRGHARLTGDPLTGARGRHRPRGQLGSCRTAPQFGGPRGEAFIRTIRRKMYKATRPVAGLRLRGRR